jgi:hypothetical protein
LAAGISALAVAATAGAAMGAEVPRGEAAITCTNTSSGASWQIKVNYDQSTVDAYPASFSDAEIKWKTPGGENYKLDRKSGNLTVVVASSTGGYFLYDRCKPEN